HKGNGVPLGDQHTLPPDGLAASLQDLDPAPDLFIKDRTRAAFDPIAPEFGYFKGSICFHKSSIPASSSVSANAPSVSIPSGRVSRGKASASSSTFSRPQAVSKADDSTTCSASGINRRSVTSRSPMSNGLTTTGPSQLPGSNH